jgi:outer membrane cobalamin receptor
MKARLTRRLVVVGTALALTTLAANTLAQSMPTNSALAQSPLVSSPRAPLQLTQSPQPQWPQPQLPRPLCLRDATTAAPLPGASVTPLDPPAAARLVRGACTPLDGSTRTVRVERAGYRAQRVRITAAGETLFVALVPIGAPQRLTTQTVTADAPAGRTVVTVRANGARARGAGTMNGLLAQLPYTQLRSARGETGVSLRGARREQVVITLDGLPLNDPATGLADVSDLPLASIATASVVPGADPVQAGSGASGGVVALTTSTQRLLSWRTGAFGEQQGEGAWTGALGATRWHGAASWRRARNDFDFTNDAGVAPVRETRVNNDERRAVIAGGLIAPRTQVSVLASTGERGMVGAANVRSYDADRARTDRLLARAQQNIGSTVLGLGARGFSLAYRDPTRPALDTRARVWAADADWRGALAPSRWYRGSWRAGGGVDGLRGTGGVVQQRTRGFLAYAAQRELAGARALVDLGLRTDVIERAGTQPTANLGLTWHLRRAAISRVSAVARAAQAVRVPTLYDLYFSSPQRLFVRTLNPERVTLDASAGFTGGLTHARVMASGEVLVVSRNTRDAIVWFPGNFGWSPANVGRETLRGVEARAALQHGPVSLASWVTSYDAQLLSNGLRIPTPYVPRLASGTQLALTRGATVVSPNVRYQGRRPYTAGPRNPFFELPAVWLADAAISHHRSARRADVVVTLAIDNVNNARWQSVRGFPMPGRSWSLGITLHPDAR